MFGLTVVAYFAGCALLAALLLLPEVRNWLATRLRSGSVRIGGRASRALTATGRSARDAATQTGAGTTAFARFLQRHRWLLLASVAMLTIGPLAAWLLRDQVQLDAFEDDYRPPNPQIAVLLEGEKLVAPAPLPPEVFSTAEVEQLRPLLASADRKWDLMDPAFVQRLLVVFKLMREQYGYDMALLEGYRSPERQNLLAQMGGSVTNARAFQSWHQYGLAADCAFYRDGKLVISEKDPWAMRGYQLYGQTAASLGLVWGGSWKLADLGHVELRRAGVMKHS